MTAPVPGGADPAPAAPGDSRDLVLEADNAALANLAGQFDENLRQIERRLGIAISSRANRFRLLGPAAALDAGTRVLRQLGDRAAREHIDAQHVHVAIQEALMAVPGAALPADDDRAADAGLVKTRRVFIKPRGSNQRAYIDAIRAHDLSFGIGPAGTGKTYLAVASAVAALEEERVRRIVLVRPAVEAGERLGFLPGDLSQKVDPYLRPMYDALYEMLGFDRVARLIERNIIEVAPLAFMRGRSLNESFVLLDEAQNTTVEQMKMFLTRLGFGSRAVVTGDITQIDLPRHQQSGLNQAMQVLGNVPGVSFTVFTAGDVVRHPLVQQIVEAYQQFDRQGAAAPDDGGKVG